MENESSSSDSSDDIINKVFFKKYHCIKKLGEGSFGRIYEGVYNSEHFALKFEDINSNSNLLESEASIMNYLKGPNIPNVRSYGTSGNYNILIMQLMGKSLEDLINIRKTFPLKTVCLIGYQMIKVLEYIHNKHIVHRDLKPDNFVMGLNELAKYVYLLDFGLAKKYRSSTTLKHYPLINKKKLTGTARYASINALRGYEQSRRDDLESAGYVLMYFLRGSLPWQGIPGKNKDERYKKILQKKEETTAHELCKDFPEEFEKYIDYTRNMEYEEDPDYERLKEYFKNIIEEKNENFDYIYIWSTEEEKKQRKKEFLEEKKRLSRQITSKTNNMPLLHTKIENVSNFQHTNTNTINEEITRRKSKFESAKNNKFFERENKLKERNETMKGNYKFVTKENSIEENKNKTHRMFNSPEIGNNRRNSKARTHNMKRRSSKIENNVNELKRENEEICCTEACIII